MTRWSRRLELPLVVLLLVTGLSAASTPAPASAQAKIPRFDIDKCTFKMPERQVEGQTVKCGYAVVPEDHANPTGATVTLAVAVFKTPVQQPAPDPLIYLSGGPGGPAVEDFADIGAVFAGVMGRDVIIFDQRGVGLSRPSLLCQERIDLNYESLDKAVRPEEAISQTVKATAACRDRLVKQGVNLQMYTSAVNAADVNDLRLALGYDKVNLWGISYGTKLALTVMRDFPNVVRSAVIDAVYPPQVDGTADPILTGQRAFREVFKTCASDSDCNSSYPNLEQVTYDLYKQLNEKPITLKVKHFRTGKPYTVVVDGDGLIEQIFNALYITSFLPRLPAMIYTASKGDYSILSEIVSVTKFQFEDISMGTFYSVECGEETSFSSPEKVKEAAKALPDLIRPNQLLFQLSSFEICNLWGAKKAAPVENEPVTSDIPTLVMSGQFDPITPPAYGELAAQSLKNSYVFVFPGIGHGSSIENICPIRMFISFVRDPTQKPNSSCIGQMKGLKFEISPTR